LVLKGCHHTVFCISLRHAHKGQNAVTSNHFFIFLSNHNAESIHYQNDKIFFYQGYDKLVCRKIVSKQFKHILNLHIFFFLKAKTQSQITIKYKTDILYHQKYYPLGIFF